MSKVAYRANIVHLLVSNVSPPDNSSFSYFGFFWFSHMYFRLETLSWRQILDPNFLDVSTMYPSLILGNSTTSSVLFIGEDHRFVVPTGVRLHHETSGLWDVTHPYPDIPRRWDLDFPLFEVLMKFNLDLFHPMCRLLPYLHWGSWLLHEVLEWYLLLTRTWLFLDGFFLLTSYNFSDQTYVPLWDLYYRQNNTRYMDHLLLLLLAWLTGSSPCGNLVSCGSRSVPDRCRMGKMLNFSIHGSLICLVLAHCVLWSILEVPSVRDLDHESCYSQPIATRFVNNRWRFQFPLLKW